MTPTLHRAKTTLVRRAFCLSLPLALALVAGMNPAHGAEPETPDATTAWAQAQSETDPARRRAADLRAAQAGSLPAMERLLVTGRFQEIALIDVRQPPFSTWNKMESTGDAALTPQQIHGLMLANWALRNAFLLANHGADVMAQARTEMASGTTTHPLLAMELAWHLHSFEPKDPATARGWFDKAKAWHIADTKADRWLHFCQAVDLATVAVNNGYADVAVQLTESVEQAAPGFNDPYAVGMAALVRAFLQQSAWTGKPDPLGLLATSKAAAATFARADAPVMRAYALTYQAGACLMLAETQPQRRQEAYRLFSECAAIYEQLGAHAWQAMSLTQRARCAETFAASADDLRLAVRLMTTAKEECGQAGVTMWLIQALSFYQPAEHHDEVVSLADALIPRMPALGLAQFIPKVQEWRAHVVESRRALKGR